MLSVVIPTRNRHPALRRTLASLARQRAPEGGFEVVVVHEGAEPETPELLEGFAGMFPAPLVGLEAQSSGPGPKRNAGAAAARAELLLFLGDDTAPADDLVLVRHAQLHEGRDDRHAVLGRITWDQAVPITPFMHWLENGGPQFHYGHLEPGPVAVEDYFYASHVSIKRSIFERVGGFNARFPLAGLEDIELGVRLAALGVELHYHPELLLLHDHPKDLAGYLQRMRDVGRSACLYNELHPEHPHAAIGEARGPRWALLRAAVPLLRPLAGPRVPRPLRERGWWLLHLAAYADGYREGPP